MRFREILYIGKYVQENKAKILANLQQRKISPTVFVLLVCDNRIEIVYNALLFLSPYTKKSWTVVGIAHGKLEAFRLMEKIVADAVDAGMEMDLVHFLSGGKEGEGCQ